MSRAQNRPRVLFCDAKELMSNQRFSVPVYQQVVNGNVANGPWTRSRSMAVGPTYVCGVASSNTFTCDIDRLGFRIES